MAGDWIKVEKCSPNKPEVMRLAKLWGKDQDTAFGVIVRFWIWLDDACVDGVVDGVASHEVDAMMHFPGFAQGMKAVGWLEIDDEKPCIRVPNFTKHNAESAKKRALKSERQAKWRAKSVDAVVDAAPSTREEKRREVKALRPVAPDLPGFTAFWSSYPASNRRVAKGKCLSLWKRSGLEPIADVIAAHVRAMSSTTQWRDGYEPSPLTYLNQRRWEDGLPLPSGPAALPRQVAM